MLTIINGVPYDMETMQPLNGSHLRCGVGKSFGDYVCRAVEGDFPYSPTSPSGREITSLFPGRRCRILWDKNSGAWREGCVESFTEYNSGPFAQLTQWDVTLKMDDVASNDGAFVTGDHVEIHGLTSEKKYNGREGVVLSRMDEKGRYSVKLDDERNENKTAIVNVKPSNCRYLTEISCGINRMNIDGGGTIWCPKTGQLVSLEWLEPATPQIDLGAANVLVCPTCRSDETNAATTTSDGEQDCPVCFDSKECQTLECGHNICAECWGTWKQVCLVGSGFVPPSLNMEAIKEQRAKKHNDLQGKLPHTWNGTATKEGDSKEAVQDVIRRMEEWVPPMVEGLTKDLTSEADRLCTFYKDLMVAPVALILLQFTQNRIFKGTSNIAAMKIFVHVLNMRMDDLYEVAHMLGETVTKEDYRLRLQIRLNNCIGEAYEELENPYASIPYYVKAAQLADETGDINHIGQQYCNLGLAQKKSDLYSLAKKSYEKSMSVPFFTLQRVKDNYAKLLKEMKEWTGTSGKLTPHC